MDGEIVIRELEDTGDHRGGSFQLPERWLDFIGSIQDIHPTSLYIGAVRGNHVHMHSKEIMLMYHWSKWTFWCDNGPDTPLRCHTFEASGIGGSTPSVTYIEIPPGYAHAFVNDGTLPTIMIMLKNTDERDVIEKKIVPV